MKNLVESIRGAWNDVVASLRPYVGSDMFLPVALLFVLLLVYWAVRER